MVLVASGLKLLNVPTLLIGIALAVSVVAAAAVLLSRRMGRTAAQVGPALLEAS